MKIKRKKLQILTLLACVFALAGSRRAFGEETQNTAGWRQEGEDWRYYGKDGSPVYNTWQQGADGGWYYLGPDSRMETACIIEDKNNYYYVDELGRMASDQWVKTTGPYEDGERWYCFKENGKAYKSGNSVKPVEIGGSKYLFDEYGRMLYGWVTEDGEMADPEDEYGWRDALYYCGAEDDGAVNTGWKSLEITYEDSEGETQLGAKWFYFGPNNGKKSIDKTMTLEDENGKKYKYRFDEYGVMYSKSLISSSQDRTSRSASSGESRYYDSSGRLAKDRWYQAIPDSSQNKDDYENETKRWFYSDKSGKVVKNQMKKVDGKYYLFDQAGIMKTGLVAVSQSGTYQYTLMSEAEEDDCFCTSAQVYKAHADGYDIYYFNKQGIRQSGKETLELEDDRYVFRFGTDGKALHGTRDGYLYQAGILQKADQELKYEVKQLDGQQYLVNRTGKIQGAGIYQDGNGRRWSVSADAAGVCTVAAAQP